MIHATNEHAREPELPPWNGQLLQSKGNVAGIKSRLFSSVNKPPAYRWQKQDWGLRNPQIQKSTKIQNKYTIKMDDRLQLLVLDGISATETKPEINLPAPREGKTCRIKPSPHPPCRPDPRCA